MTIILLLGRYVIVHIDWYCGSYDCAQVKIDIHKIYDLAHTNQSHIDLEGKHFIIQTKENLWFFNLGRASAGKLLLKIGKD